MKARVQISIRGVVQGVGFRPFIFRLAEHFDLKGFVRNSVSGVTIEAEGNKKDLEDFLLKVKDEKPSLASIQGMEFSFLDPVGYNEFKVLESSVNGVTDAFILPDIALCTDCLEELFDKNNRRYLYPFINCTNCGPRYSIIESLPYDRANTSMKSFIMCKECREEYDNPSDRRFHAQPVACHNCGPYIKLLDKTGEMISERKDVIGAIISLLDSGKIIALKGLGGYQLIVNAENDKAIDLLRERKQRATKPFAVMVKDIPMAEQLCELNELEKRLLTSPESPVVLIRKKRNAVISDYAAPGNPYLGIMLPYTPLHHMIMQQTDYPIIATSGNLSEEPMCINEYEAFNRLQNIADFFLIHNRSIVRAVDDSVVRIVKGREMIIRRARGYAPLPLSLKKESAKKFIALGGQLKNSISLVKGENIIVSQHLGDLENNETEEYVKRTINDLLNMYDAEADIILHDLHPGYTSTRIANEMKGEKYGIQHHQAHAAACYFENQVEGKCLAVVWDGTGYGTDRTIWGGEFFQFNGREFLHSCRLKQFIIPGGDSAIKDIKRSAAGVLYSLYGDKMIKKVRRLSEDAGIELEPFNSLLNKNLNCFTTSSMGRLFDAAAYLLGVSRHSYFEGESAMLLEFSIEPGIKDNYPFEISNEGLMIIDWHPLFEKLLFELREKIPHRIIAAKFHNTLIKMIVTVALILNEKKVVLSGGCFQNIYLLNGVIEKLKETGITPYWHQRIPANDGGISFGQASLAATIL
jgi:hydrogenase maturation protein HypF